MKEHSKITETVKKVMPAVVSIAVSKKLEQIEKELLQAYPSSPGTLRPNIPPEMVDAHGMVQVGGGSGFIVNKKGVILTNKHVIGDPTAQYTVITSEGKKLMTDVIARDPLDDIAILQIKPPLKNIPTVELGNSKKTELGQTVLAFGNALGIFKNTVSSGIISGLSRAIQAKPDPGAPPQEMRGLIQTDTAMNPGNSGGPLTNISGQVIGINTAIVAGAQNIGFAIPIQAAERDLKDLGAHGKIRRPLLGIRYLTLTPDIKAKLKLPADHGALVIRENPLDTAVAPGGPAEKAGIREHDIILEWNNEKITQEKTIRDYLENSTVDDIILLKILRGNKTIKKEVALTERR